MARDVEVIIDAVLSVALYRYNDVLLRIDETVAGSRLDALALNTARVYLQIDGQPPLGPSFLARAPRLRQYGASSHYNLLQLGGESPATALDGRPPLKSCEVYGLPEGEARRRVTLLRRRWPHELAQLALPQADEGSEGSEGTPTGAVTGAGDAGDAGTAGSCEASSCSYDGSGASDAVTDAEQRRLQSELRAQRVLSSAAALQRDAGRRYRGGERVPTRTLTRTEDARSACALIVALQQDALGGLLELPEEGNNALSLLDA